jgi:hypothetical protein
VSDFPEALYVSGSSLLPCSEDWESIRRDPRGILLMWHPPQKNRKYIMGLDPTVGITGWNRGSRTSDDHRIDNAAIEIFEPDGAREPLYTKNEKGERVLDIDPVTKRQRWLYRDVQVAEFAAPCDAIEIARICNVLGRIYAGNEEDQCELIYESYPGPGMLTTQELLRLGYSNLWMWETFADGQAEGTSAIGWHSTPRSQKALWYRARRHLMNRNAVIRSQWLLDEYAGAEMDMEKMRARASYGRHDDRFQAANMAFWAGHKWSYDIERSDELVTTVPEIDFQRYAPTLDDNLTYADWRARATADWD